MERDESPLHPAPGGARLHVRLTPRGGRDAVDGVKRDAAGRAHLAVRVSAPPEGGKANAALLGLIAKRFGLPRGAVEIASGDTARAKQLHLAGEFAALAERFQAITSD